MWIKMKMSLQGSSYPKHLLQEAVPQLSRRFIKFGASDAVEAAAHADISHEIFTIACENNSTCDASEHLWHFTGDHT